MKPLCRGLGWPWVAGHPKHRRTADGRFFESLWSVESNFVTLFCQLFPLCSESLESSFSFQTTYISILISAD